MGQPITKKIMRNGLRYKAVKLFIKKELLGDLKTEACKNLEHLTDDPAMLDMGKIAQTRTVIAILKLGRQTDI